MKLHIYRSSAKTRSPASPGTRGRLASVGYLFALLGSIAAQTLVLILITQ